MPIPGLENLRTPTGRARLRQQEAGSPALPVPPSPSTIPATSVQPTGPQAKVQEVAHEGQHGGGLSRPAADVPLVASTLVGLPLECVPRSCQGESQA